MSTHHTTVTKEFSATEFFGWVIAEVETEMIIDHDPGVRYYPDGSGQPPTTDVQVFARHATITLGWFKGHEITFELGHRAAEWLAEWGLDINNPDEYEIPEIA